MSETLQKLRPDRDLQCYFERPSAIAAMSGAASDRFTVSGTWRQQFDWTVVEWNRDNVFEHPMFRNLPDGALSGVQLSYEETRSNCIPIDSDLFPTVDWPYLRVWAEFEGAEHFYQVPLIDHATAIEGSYQSASADFELQGTISDGDIIGLTWAEEQYNYAVTGSDTLDSAAEALAGIINTFSTTMEAVQTGASIRLTIADATSGLDGNRLGAYGFVSGVGTETWSPVASYFSGGTSPTKWRIDLDFDDLQDRFGVTVPMGKVRKMRWTYAADFQTGAFERSEFEVLVTNWTVTGTGLGYVVAGPGSRRIEDDSAAVAYSGTWGKSAGNFSGGTIHHTIAETASLSCEYVAAQTHSLYLGTRYAFNGATVSAVVDGGTAQTFDLFIAGEDSLARVFLGEYGAGAHTVSVTHAGTSHPSDDALVVFFFYFDFLELAVPASELPTFTDDDRTTLATDWDTDHSISLPPERTAWMIQALGFKGRANNYVGALWFYELVKPGHVYASGTVTFTGTPPFSETTSIAIGRHDHPEDDPSTITHLNLIGDTAETVAKAFELIINSGFTAIRAQASGDTLTIFSRSMGLDGNEITLSASATGSGFTAAASGDRFTGGMDGDWRTDLVATPRLNRAVRDWSRSFYTALDGYSIDVAAAFSMELQHGDPDAAAGIAQRYPDGDAVLLNTPALQTNFSPESTAFWKEVYLDMAAVMAAAGVQPYLQFGEVQWWYFPNVSGMTYYDAYTKDSFQTAFGREIAVITTNTADPASFPDEAAFLPQLIGTFTSAVMSHVRATYTDCRFEVLYPPDVNEFAFNQAVNYPASEWIPANLDALKTESFTYTLERDLDKSKASMEYSSGRGFVRAKRSHLIGISDPSTAWFKEMRMAKAEGVESIVLFALDQYCLIGYATPLPRGLRRSLLLG